MKKSSSLAAAALVLLFGAPGSMATQDVMVSGEKVIAILDTDQDGMPEKEDDCNFRAEVDGADVMVDASLGTGIQLQGCSGDYWGTGSTNSGIAINFTSSNAVGTVQLPTMVDLHGSNGNGAGAGSNGLPHLVDPPLLEIDFPDASASGSLCSSGGMPAVQVRTTDGTTVVFPLTFYPSMSEPEYLKAPKIPISNVIGQTVLIDGYIPVTPDKMIIATLEGGNGPIVEIDLNRLPGCGGLGVPTTTEWGLIALVLALLATGVWLLRGRPQFVSGLSAF